MNNSHVGTHDYPGGTVLWLVDVQGAPREGSWPGQQGQGRLPGGEGREI